MNETQDLHNSLRNNHSTRVKVNHNYEAEWARKTAIYHWLTNYRNLSWTTIHTLLDQTTERTHELSNQTTTTQNYGRINHLSLKHLPLHMPFLLYIVECDIQTPQYIYDNVNRLTTHPTSRILIIEWQTQLRLLTVH